MSNGVDGNVPPVFADIVEKHWAVVALCLMRKSNVADALAATADLAIESKDLGGMIYVSMDVLVDTINEAKECVAFHCSELTAKEVSLYSVVASTLVVHMRLTLYHVFACRSRSRSSMRTNAQA